MATHAQTNAHQYQDRAQAYLSSHVHAQGPDLAHVRTLWRDKPAAADEQALDVGCGAGHLSMVLRERFAQVWALDATATMCALVRQRAVDEGVAGLSAIEGDVHALPFADRALACVASRYSAHHWGDLGQALREIDRVLAPGGQVLIIDVLGHEDALVDTHMQCWELLRDASHVRNRTSSQWLAYLQELGWQLHEQAQWPTPMAFDEWVQRMKTPPDRVAVLRQLIAQAPHEVRGALAVQDDGSFTLTTGLFVASKSR